MAKRKLRVTKWEKEHDLPWYKKLYYKKFFVLPSNEKEAEALGHSVGRRYRKYKGKQEKAKEKGDKEAVRKYGREAMLVAKEDGEIRRQMREDVETIRGKIFSDLMNISLAVKDKEVDRLTSEVMRLIDREEKGLLSHDEAEERLLDLYGKLSERINKVYSERKD